MRDTINNGGEYMSEKMSNTEMLEFSRNVMKLFNRIEKMNAECCGITVGQYEAIIEVGSNKEMTLKELADRLELDNSTTSRTVNNLVKKRILKTEVDAQDRRYIKIKLTNCGTQIYSKFQSQGGNLFSRLLESVPEEKREQVIESFQILLKSIE